MNPRGGTDDESFGALLTESCVRGELAQLLALGTTLFRRGVQALPGSGGGGQDRLRGALEVNCKDLLADAQAKLAPSATVGLGVRPVSRLRDDYWAAAQFAVEALLDVAWLRAFGVGWAYTGPVQPTAPDREVVSTYRTEYAALRIRPEVPEALLWLFEYGHTINPAFRDPKVPARRARPMDPLPAPPPTPLLQVRPHLSWSSLVLLSALLLGATFLSERLYMRVVKQREAASSIARLPASPT